MRLVILLFFFSFTQSMLAQNLFGVVVDQQGESLEGVNVYLTELKSGTVTDSLGQFSFSNIKDGVWTIEISYIGFVKQSKSVQLAEGQEIFLEFKLLEDSELLGEMVISQKSEATMVRDEAYAVEVMDMSTFKALCKAI